MKATAFALTLIVALSISTVAGIHFVKTAHASALTVPDDYPAIQTAINSANEGDTIFVKGGTYREQQLIINKTLSLIGENPDNTEIILNPPEGPYGSLETWGHRLLYHDRSQQGKPLRLHDNRKRRAPSPPRHRGRRGRNWKRNKNNWQHP